MEAPKASPWSRKWYAFIHRLPYRSFLIFHADVTDLAWSPEDRFLASTGLDSQVMIWCGYTLDRIIKLDLHQGFVKGVCWDPVGEFLATQSDDRTVRIWRTTDWGLEATVKKPFEHSPGSTFFRRLRCVDNPLDILILRFTSTIAGRPMAHT